MTESNTSEHYDEIITIFDSICKSHSSNLDQRSRFLDIIQILRSTHQSESETAPGEDNITRTSDELNNAIIIKDIFEIKLSLVNVMNELNSKFAQLTESNATLSEADKLINNPICNPALPIVINNTAQDPSCNIRSVASPKNQSPQR